MADPLPRATISHEPISVVLVAGTGDAAETTEIVSSWTGVLDGLARPYEIILVRDREITAGAETESSTLAEGKEQAAEKTAEVLETSEVCTVRYSDLPGIGANLREGIAQARYPLLFYSLCDRQFQPSDLKRLLEAIDQVDLVTGYRVAAPVPAWLALLDALRRGVTRFLFGMEVPRRDSWLGWANWKRRCLARWLFGVAVQDPECAFRLFRRELFRRIPIQSNGDLANIEILAKANFLGALITEVPVTWLPPKEWPALATRHARKGEVFRLFTKPDFGPAVLNG